MQHAIVYPHFVFACLPSIACVRVGHLRLEVCGRVEAQRCFVIVGSISISILRVMFVRWILGVGLYIQRKFYGVVLVVLVDIYQPPRTKTRKKNFFGFSRVSYID